MLFAILAVIAFALALLLHLIGHGVARYVLDAELVGFLCLALHLAGFGGYVAGRFRGDRTGPAA